MKTHLLRSDTPDELRASVDAAVDLLRAGEVVAMPTETVYGLAADALNASAALKIFEAKERPRFDPLIVHLPDPEWLSRVANIPASDAALVTKLTNAFWPGPLTLVLPRQQLVNDVVTAGLDTVAVRVSAHPVFTRIVRAFGGPLAAPSANRFGRISPTQADHVRSELDERIRLIIDGGATDHGVESTIVWANDARLTILRPGPITSEQLRAFAEAETAAPNARAQAPGQFASHYAPRTPLVLVDDLATFELPVGGKVAALAWRENCRADFAENRTLSEGGDLREAAANLFRFLRELDAAGVDLIVAERVPEEGLGTAIMDRLRRAASR